MANRNFPSSKMYTGHIMPVLLDCNFVVDSANGNGLGIRNLKGPLVQNVFMHTSASAGAGNSNPASPGIPVINPNPASGSIVVQLQDNYNRIYTGGHSCVAPLGSSQIVSSGLTAGVAYVITIVGDATAADWAALGLPAGVAPAVGAAFIAASTGHGAATVTRVAPTAAAGSTIMSIETVGDSNAALSPNTLAGQGFGAQLILQCRNVSGAIAAPADNSVISLSFLLSNSSVLTGNE